MRKEQLYDIDGTPLAPITSAECVYMDENTTVKETMTDNGQKFRFGYLDGKFGYYTDDERGADSFSPFSSFETQTSVKSTYQAWVYSRGNITPNANMSDYEYILLCFTWGDGLAPYTSKFMTTEEFFKGEEHGLYDGGDRYSLVRYIGNNTISLSTGSVYAGLAIICYGPKS